MPAPADGRMTFKARDMNVQTAAVLLLVTVLAACAGSRPSAGSRYDHRFVLPAERAAQCFAHNAEERSSALVAEVTRLRDGRMEVTVRVRNGVTYASATIEPSARGSIGAIRLNVESTEGTGSLMQSLVKDC